MEQVYEQTLINEGMFRSGSHMTRTDESPRLGFIPRGFKANGHVSHAPGP